MRIKHSRCSLRTYVQEDSGFNLRKFYSNSAALEARVNPDPSRENDVVNENTLPKSTAIEELEETYSSSTLGGTQKLHRGEQKVLGI